MASEIPFYNLEPQHEQIKAEAHCVLADIFDSGWYVLGDRLKKFEEDYAIYTGVKHCIGVGNGLDALKISLKALGIGKGDEVLVPAHTYIATVLAISEIGALPVLIEPHPQTLNIDPLRMEEKITSRTRAVIPVHLYGLPCEMDLILDIADKHQLFVIEDNAQASGSVYKGRKTGSFGHLNAHSFYPTKNLGCLGDGGAITTNDEELARKVRMYRNYGSEEKYKNELMGYNSRLDELQAGVLSIKLKYLDQWNGQKRLLMQRYRKGTQDISGFHMPEESSSEVVHSYHLCVALCDQRDALMAHLKKQRIQTLVHYPLPVYKQKAYQDQFLGQEFPLTDSLSTRLISLPLFPGMTNDQADRVIEALQQFRP